MQGIRTLVPFTSWSWNLLGVSFGVNSFIAHHSLGGNPVPLPLLRVALLLYETAVPASFLVTFVVSYIIWPNIIKQGGSTKGISSPRTLVWHNANVAMALLESAMLGGIPITLSHATIIAFYGISYVLFTWILRHFWVPHKGPQFLYFFFDTTLGKTTTFALLALLGVMMSFYAIFCFAEMLLTLIGGGLLTHVLFVLVLCALLCRFKD